MDFGSTPQQQPQSPVDVVLGIREELAEFRRNGGKQAMRTKWRKACGEALSSLASPELSFEQALAEPGGIIEYLRDRGVIRIERPRNRRRGDGNVVSLQTARKQD
jgi:hypothetical protein